MVASMMNIQSSEKPLSMFKIFKPTEKKLRFLAQHLLDGYLNLPDEKRNRENINSIIRHYFYAGNKNLYYEVGNFGAILGFVNIVFGYKCEVHMKFWDKNVWSKGSVREAKELIKTIKNQFRLEKLTTETSDKRVVKMAEIMGFEIEEIKPLDFCWNGEFFPTYIMSIINNKED